MGAILAALASEIFISPAIAGPYVAGDRTFPATPTTNYPFVADAAYGSVTSMREGAPDTGIRQTALGFGVEKRITEDLGIEVEDAYNILNMPARKNAYGFGNVEATAKYQLFLSDEHEFLLSAGVQREFGGSGANRVGAEAVSATTPTLFFGKGLGDLPESVKYLRPIAITGTVGYQRADQRTRTIATSDPQSGVSQLSVEHNPDQFVLGFAFEYSLRYLEGNVAYLGLPAFIGRLTPVVEFAYTMPIGTAFGAPTTGIIAPGFIYSANGIDLGVEALIPATRQSGTNVGVIASVHIPFETFLPAAAGKPLFGGEHREGRP